MKRYHIDWFEIQVVDPELQPNYPPKYSKAAVVVAEGVSMVMLQSWVEQSAEAGYDAVDAMDILLSAHRDTVFEVV